MSDVVMADSIGYLPEYQGWYAAIKGMMDDIDLGKLLVYLIDNVDAVAIPFLADQFNVLGYNGMRMATTEAAQREIIKRAIELQRYKGTEWAIKEALLSIGFANVELKKGVAGGYDHWAKFGIDITHANVTLTDSAFTDIEEMVLKYKRAVCVLEDISLNLQVVDALFIDDEEATVLQAIIAEDVLILSSLLFYDGTAEYNGDYEFSGDTDLADVV